MDQNHHSKHSSQIARCFVPQSRSSRYNMHCELTWSEDGRPRPTEHGKAEEACHVLGTWETMRSSVQLWKDGQRSDRIHRLGLGRLPRDSKKPSSARVVQLGNHTPKACTRKQKIIARSSAEAELHAEVLGSSESKGIVSLLKDMASQVETGAGD